MKAVTTIVGSEVSGTLRMDNMNSKQIYPVRVRRKEEECLGVSSLSRVYSSGSQSVTSSNQKTTASDSAKTDPPSLRLASEVATEIRQWAWLSDATRDVIADRVATLDAWEKYKEGCFNSRDPRTYDGLQADFIAYLKGQTP